MCGSYLCEQYDFDIDGIMVILRTAWSDDCNFSSTGGLKCLDCLKSFTDIVRVSARAFFGHHFRDRPGPFLVFCRQLRMDHTV